MSLKVSCHLWSDEGCAVSLHLNPSKTAPGIQMRRDALLAPVGKTHKLEGRMVRRR